eukprot:TRINITY_DN23397_c0_g1_i1.p1 TRINITY_DN23397_c0_g1~~TRINITY_DN23397_c0_g1_i1.p1  ORF type:complete len:136 (+),score=28.45 TRINITY_DN23397_c0_g1_i1:422-829(+)
MIVLQPRVMLLCRCWPNRGAASGAGAVAAARALAGIELISSPKQIPSCVRTTPAAAELVEAGAGEIAFVASTPPSSNDQPDVRLFCLCTEAFDMVIQSVPVLCVDTCLLYTSDAADEEDSVDLGGRRIIKKKKKE